MAEFYISLETANEHSEHQIHRDSCSELPAKNTLKYLGSFASKEAAHSKSRSYFDQVSFCPSCLTQA